MNQLHAACFVVVVHAQKDFYTEGCTARWSVSVANEMQSARSSA